MMEAKCPSKIIKTTDDKGKEYFYPAKINLFSDQDKDNKGITILQEEATWGDSIELNCYHRFMLRFKI